MKTTFISLLLTLLCWSTAYAAPPDNLVYPDVMIHLHSSGVAHIVSTETDELLASLPTAAGGTLGSVTPDATKLYVGAAAAGQTRVTVIDLQNQTVVKTLDTGSRPKHPLVSPDGKMVIVNHWGLDNGKLRFSFIDTATDEVIQDVEVGVSDSAATKVASMHNSWSWDSKTAFGVDRIDNQLVVIDTSDWSVIEKDLPSAPHYPVVSPDGKEIWVVVEGVDRDNRPGVVIFDLTDPTVPQIARLDMPLIGEEVVEGHHGNFTRDGKYFMVANRGGGDTKVGREIAFFDAKEKTLVRRLTTASNGVGHAYLSPDGRHVFVTNYGNNVVTIIDLENGICTVADLEIGTGRMGHVAFTKDGRYAYVSNAADGNLFKVDMESFKVVKEIETGNAPGGGQVLNLWTNVFEDTLPPTSSNGGGGNGALGAWLLAGLWIGGIVRRKRRAYRA